MSTDIAPEDRKPVLQHGNIGVVPQENKSGFILFNGSNKMYVDRENIAMRYNTVGQTRNLLGADASFRLREVRDVLAVLFLLEGFERTHQGALLEEAKTIVPEEELEQILTNPYKIEKR